MLIIKPSSAERRSERTSLSFNKLEKLTSIAKPEEIKLSVPKFNIKQGAALKAALSYMGLGDMFDPRMANFSGMVEPHIASPLYINEAIHSAAIRVCHLMLLRSSFIYAL